MTFDEVWESLCDKNVALRSGTTRVEFTATNLRKLLQQVYDKGRASGMDNNAFSKLFNAIVKK